MEEEYEPVNEITSDLLEYWLEGRVSSQSVSHIIDDFTGEPTGEVEILYHAC